MILDGAPSLDEFEDCFVNNSGLDRISGYLNRFNPIRIMRMENMEIRHSAILAWLLDPTGTHGFDDKFLKAFLAQALFGQGATNKPTALDVSQADLRDAEVRREKSNIDLFVASASNGWAFVIENKFHSKQHSGQLKRYIDHAKAEAEISGLEFRIRGIFLTLHDEAPDEEAKSSYVPLRYEAICKIIDNLLNGGDVKTSVEVRQFLHHYLEIIKDAAGMSEEQRTMEALAKDLYRSHRAVLEFVMRHGASTDFNLATESVFGSDLKYGDEREVDGTSYMFSWNNDHQFSFIPVSWRNALGGEEGRSSWDGCKKWWAGYPLICWFQIYEGKYGATGSLKLFAEVGPLSDTKLRAELIACIRNSAEKSNKDNVQFRSDADKDGARYSKFFKSSRATYPLKNISDSDEIVVGMRELLNRFKATFEVIASSLTEFNKPVKTAND